MDRRLRKLVLAAIALPPRKTIDFLNKLQGKRNAVYNRLIQTLTNLVTWFRNNAVAYEYEPQNVHEFLKDVSGYRLTEEEVLDLANYLKMKQQDRNFMYDFSESFTKERLGWMVEALGYDIESLTSYALDRLNYWVELGVWERIPDNMHSYVPRAQVDAWQFPQELAAIFRELSPQRLSADLAEMADWQRKLQARIEYGKTDWSTGKEIPPESDDVEILYHASINAVKLYREGFSERIPGTEGIGGAQDDANGQRATSFTSDLYVAKEIARSLKESVMLVQGTYKLSLLFDAMKQDGVYDDVMKYYRSYYGHTEVKTPADRFHLYKTYLVFSEDKGKRYNPLFFGHYEDFAKLFAQANVKDIGVVSAKVNMRDPDIKYLASMHEYRVPPRAILGVEGLIQ